MKIHSLTGLVDGKAVLIEGPLVDGYDKLKPIYDKILDAKGVMSKGKGSVKFSSLYLTEHVRGEVRKRSC